VQYMRGHEKVVKADKNITDTMESL
jgi:hypothetical protein